MGAPVGKSPSACPAKMLPFVLNNTWTYSQDKAAAAANPAPEAIVKIAPAQPDSIKITVKAIDKKGTDTVVTLEEVLTYPGKAPSIPTSKKKDAPKGDKPAEEKPAPLVRTLSTTVTCSATKFDISPESYFFAGEPGGYYGMTFDKIDRKNTSWKIIAGGAFSDDKWEEDLHIDWSRQATKGSDAKLGGGKLDLERVYTPGQTEIIMSNPTVTGSTGNWKADILFLATTGRVTLDGAGPEDKPAELPAGWTAQMWTFPNVGIVKTRNPYGHVYVLTDAQLY